MEQVSLFESPAVRIDETNWEIYDGKKLIGYYEVDGTGYDFRSCAGPGYGGNGPMWEYTAESMLEKVSESLIRHYRLTKRR